MQRSTFVFLAAAFLLGLMSNSCVQLVAPKDPIRIEITVRGELEEAFGAIDAASTTR